MCAYMCIGMCTYICIGLCIGMCLGMCIAMYAYMCIAMCTYMCKWHVHIHELHTRYTHVFSGNSSSSRCDEQPKTEALNEAGGGRHKIYDISLTP